MKKINYTEIGEAIASQDLKDKANKKIKKTDAIVHCGYTDYGGTFTDKVLIQYFKEKHPKNILWENTSYSGQNAFIFGKPAKEFYEEYEKYPLGYEDLEEFYMEKEHEAEQEGFDFFMDDLERKYTFDRDEVNSELNEKFGGYFNMSTQGMDYSEDTMIEHLKEKGLLTEGGKAPFNPKKAYGKGGTAKGFEYSIGGL